MLSDKKIKELAAEYFEEEVDRRGRVNYSTDTYGLIDFARAIEAECAKVPVKDEPVAFFIVEQWMHYEQASKDTPGAFPVFTRPQPDLTAEVERLRNLSVCEACIEIPSVGEYVAQCEQRIAALEEAARQAPRCPKCRTEQVQIIDCSPLATWKCRHCKHIWRHEPLVSNAEGKPTPD